MALFSDKGSKLNVSHHFESVKNPKSFPWRVFLRTIFVQLALLLGAIAVSGFLARSFFKDRTIVQLEEQLDSAMRIASHSLTPTSQQDWCKFSADGTHYRVTLIKIDGAVLCDSHHNSAIMENHLDRPEVSDAVGTGRGVSIRHSATDAADMLYLARSSANSELVVRFALPLSDLYRTLQSFDRALFAALIFIALLLTLGEVWVAHVFVKPLRTILLRAEMALRTQENGLQASDLGRSTWGEWEFLEGVMESLRRDIKDKMDALRNEKNEQAVIMDSISDAIVVVGINHKILYVNRNFQETFSGSSQFKGKSIVEFVREPAVLAAFSSAMNSHERNEVSILPLETLHGHRYFSLALAPLLRAGNDIKNADASIYGAVGVFHDVTDLKLAEQMRIDFVANVSHEIRTPLASIKGYANTALADLNANIPVTSEILEPIVRNSERMVRLVSDLLDLSSLDAGVALEKCWVDTNEISTKVCELFAEISESRLQKIAVEGKAVSIFVDPSRIEQVLSNLIENACKYTPSGGCVDLLWTENDAEVVLEVRDNGPGIEAEHLPRLFERFYRVDKGRSRNLGGTGLGLAIVKHIVLAHGGTVSVKSVLGTGTSFFCCFPKRAFVEVDL